MAVKAILTEDEFTALPEPLQEHYAKQSSGEFRLDVTPTGGLQLENPTKLKTTITKLTKGQNAALDALRQYGEAQITADSALEFTPALTPDQFSKMEADLEAAQKTLQQQDPKQKISQAVEEATGKVRRELIAAHQAELKTSQEAAQAATAKLRTATRDSLIDRAMDQASVQGKSLLRPVLERVTGYDENDSPFIMNSEGEVDYSTQTGKPKTYEEYIGELKAQDEFKVLWGADPASGAGSSPGQQTKRRPGAVPDMPAGVSVVGM